MNEQGSNSYTYVDLSQWVQDLRKLPESVLKAAKVEWYRVGAAHLARTKANTPVGQYSNEVEFYTRDGRYVHFFVKRTPVGGQLRIRWQQTAVSVSKNVLTTVVFNNTEYAPYVEFGHRIRNKDGDTIGFVPGRYMMTQSLEVTKGEDIPRAVDAILEIVRRDYGSR